MAKLTVQFPTQTSEILSTLSTKEEITKTEVLRKALSLYKYLKEETSKQDGRKISITDKDDKILKDIVMGS